ncbi:MAG: flavin-dependent monooxygenase [Alphaproteobacteria bacterium]
MNLAWQRTDALPKATIGDSIGAALIARALDLVPTLRSRAEATEQARRVPDETIADFRRAQLTRALLPKRYKGYAEDFGVAARICEALGRGCPSSAWVYANFILLQWQVGLFPVQAQDEVWGSDNDALVSAGYMPVGRAVPVDGGYRVSGSWNYISGVDNAEWCVLGGHIVDRDGESVEQGFFLLRRTDFAIVDNWHAVGLTGTGSKGATAKDVFMPRHRFLSLAAVNSGDAPGRQVNDHPIFRAPLYGIFNYFLSGVAFGAVQGAIDDFIDGIKPRTTVGGVTGAQTPLARLPTIQIALAEAEAMVDAARTLVQRDCDNVVATLMAGKTLSLDQRIHNRRSIGFGVRLSKEAVSGLFDVVGAAGLLNHNLIQRHWRDVHAIAHHLSLNWNMIGSLVGGYRLGVEPVGMY